MVLRVLSALEAAAAAGLVHCDVRPSNIVVSSGQAVLVDWGIVCSEGTSVGPQGVPAFVDSRLWLPETASKVAARHFHDVLAALYSWMAIAFCQACEAPWRVSQKELLQSPDEELAALFSARAHWIQARAHLHPRAKRVSDCISLLENMQHQPGMQHLPGSGTKRKAGVADGPEEPQLTLVQLARNCLKERVL